MEKFTIPQDRENVKFQDFKKKLEQRKLTKEQDDKEKYNDLKYTIISICCTKGLILAIIIWFVAYFTNHQEIKQLSQFYVQTLITLYIGSLLSKD